MARASGYGAFERNEINRFNADIETFYYLAVLMKVISVFMQLRYDWLVGPGSLYNGPAAHQNIETMYAWQSFLDIVKGFTMSPLQDLEGIREGES